MIRNADVHVEDILMTWWKPLAQERCRLLSTVESEGIKELPIINNKYLTADDKIDDKNVKIPESLWYDCGLPTFA